MADGQIKLIENIEEGDLLMGDDSQPRKVLSLARGIDKMYDVISTKTYEKYTVNQEHILCIYNSYGTIKNPENSIIEIAVKDYINLSDHEKNELKGYKVPINFISKPVEIDTYFIGNQLGSDTNNRMI